MKNFFISVIGIIAVALMVFFVARFGYVNTQREADRCYHWQLSWADRR